MTLDELERLYDYGYWANRQLMGPVGQLPDAQFTQPVAGSRGSIRNTLVHMLNAEWNWLERSGGEPRGHALAEAQIPTAAALMDRWQVLEGHLRAFLAGLRQEDLDQVLEFTLGNGARHAMPRWAMLQQAALHGVHHRGQVALLLRALGQVPGNFDFLFYFAEWQRSR
jgi:uncharacterized damage-inducible protein DinB